MKQVLSRRGFLSRIGRVAALGGLGALVGRLLSRTPRRGVPRRGVRLCRRCPVLERCTFPEAAATRGKAGAVEGHPWISSGGKKRGDVRGLCGARPGDAPASTWLGRKRT